MEWITVIVFAIVFCISIYRFSCFRVEGLTPFFFPAVFILKCICGGCLDLEKQIRLRLAHGENALKFRRGHPGNSLEGSCKVRLVGEPGIEGDIGKSLL